LIKLL